MSHSRLLSLLALAALTACVCAAPAPATATCGVQKKGVDTSLTGGTDHQAHAVAGSAYTKVDYESDRKVAIELDGTRSHTHYFNPATKESGVIVSYRWEAKGKVIGTERKVHALFPLGKTIVKLTVVDNTGDTACDTAVVTGLPGRRTGAFCYFYPGLAAIPRKLNSGVRPEEGVAVKNIDFPDLKSIPFKGRDAPTWSMRCTAVLHTSATSAFALQRTGRVAAYSGANTTFAADAAGDFTGAVPLHGVPAGPVRLNIVYHKSGPGAQLRLLQGGKPVPESALTYDLGDVLPIVESISPTVAEATGGGQMQIFGHGFVNGVRVYVGKHKAEVQVASPTKLLVTVPTQAQAGGASVIVFVGNRAGESNNRPLRYIPAGGAGPDVTGSTRGDGPKGSSTILWKNTFLADKAGQPARIPLLASVALGPDFAYYFGSQDGFVYRVGAGKDLKITSQCKSFSMGTSRAVLGIAFNPRKKDAQPYITTSTLYRLTDRNSNANKNEVDGWANGNVETLIPGCGCFCSRKTIISGLPVSHHDHAVNKIEFLNNGDMLISVAGTTNGGDNTPENKLGGLEESPLSGAILLAKTSKGDKIDGAIRYSQYTNPNKAFKIGAADVSVYATGLRNCFGMAQTRFGKIYATDNGANMDFGLKSTGCNTQEPFKVNVRDELNLIVKGGHYGHPNRNRGRKDSKQCVWGSGIKPVATFQSSTVGIIEYVSNAFAGNLKGDLVTTQYTATSGGLQGAATRVPLGSGGNAGAPYKMASFSGVAAENGLHGEVVMPQVGKNRVAVLRPVYTPPNAPYVVAVTPKRGRPGQQVLIAGDNFKPGLSAFAGGKPCAQVTEVEAKQFKCVLPPGTGLVSVHVVNPDKARSAAFKGDFQYV